MGNLTALQYYGGKSGQGLGKWIASILPWEKKSTYIEPYAGMAGVLLNRAPVQIEILNDLNDRVVNWWRVIRDQPEEFIWLVENTPISREEFKLAISQVDDMSLTPIRRALAFHTCVSQCINSGDNVKNSNWRRKFNPNGAYYLWKSDKVAQLAERLRGVQLENCDALALLKRVVSLPQAVIYCDPPYRTANTTAYTVNVQPVDELTYYLLMQQGHVGISGYGEEWDHLGWTRHTKETLRRQIKGVGEKREEVLWTNF